MSLREFKCKCIFDILNASSLFVGKLLNSLFLRGVKDVKKAVGLICLQHFLFQGDIRLMQVTLEIIDVVINQPYHFPSIHYLSAVLC